MQTMPVGGWLCVKVWVEHLKVSHKIRVCCLIKDGNQLVKTASIQCLIQQKLFPSCNMTLKSTLGVWWCLVCSNAYSINEKWIKLKRKEAIIYCVGGIVVITLLVKFRFTDQQNTEKQICLDKNHHFWCGLSETVRSQLTGNSLLVSSFPTISNTFPVIQSRCNNLS